MGVNIHLWTRNCVFVYERRQLPWWEREFCTCISKVCYGVLSMAVSTCIYVWPCGCSHVISESRPVSSSVRMVILLEPRLSGSFCFQATWPSLYRKLSWGQRSCLRLTNWFHGHSSSLFSASQFCYWCHYRFPLVTRPKICFFLLPQTWTVISILQFFFLEST